MNKLIKIQKIATHRPKYIHKYVNPRSRIKRIKFKKKRKQRKLSPIIYFNKFDKTYKEILK